VVEVSGEVEDELVEERHHCFHISHVLILELARRRRRRRRCKPAPCSSGCGHTRRFKQVAVGRGDEEGQDGGEGVKDGLFVEDDDHAMKNDHELETHCL
jgi:hypothetical protein